MLYIICVAFNSDIDECALGMDKCSIDADCVNIAGGYRCVCKEGLRQPNGTINCEGTYGITALSAGLGDI